MMMRSEMMFWSRVGKATDVEVMCGEKRFASWSSRRALPFSVSSIFETLPTSTPLILTSVPTLIPLLCSKRTCRK